jgi:hypothetical protein
MPEILNRKVSVLLPFPRNRCRNGFSWARAFETRLNENFQDGARIRSLDFR